MPLLPGLPARMRALLAGACLLMLLFTLSLWVTPTGGSLLWGMQVLPLLLTLPGLFHQQRRARQWLGFLLLFDLLAGIVQSFSPIDIVRMLGIAITLLSLGLFVLVILTMKSSPAKSTES